MIGHILVVLSGTVPLREAEAGFCKNAIQEKLQMHAAFVTLNREFVTVHQPQHVSMCFPGFPCHGLNLFSFPRDGVTKRNQSEQSACSKHIRFIFMSLCAFCLPGVPLFAG